MAKHNPGLCGLTALAAVAMQQGAAAILMPKMIPVPTVPYIKGQTLSASLPLPPWLTLNGSMPNRMFGDADEKPFTQAMSTRAAGGILVAATEVTNVEFEAYDPEHRALRGKYNFSTGDYEAAVYVSWYDAAAYCVWLSDQTGMTYRLPTEEEAEGYIRAGTDTIYSTGDGPYPYPNNNIAGCDSWLPGQVGRDGYPCDVVANLTVGQFPSNPWGLYDAHGNVEEWCGDWYDYYPYSTSNTSSSIVSRGTIGDATGMPFPLPQTFKVTRGGSHSTDPYHLRSAARAAAMPADTSFYIGFRVVMEQAKGNRAREWLAQQAIAGSLYEKPVRAVDIHHKGRSGTSKTRAFFDSLWAGLRGAEQSLSSKKARSPSQSRGLRAPEVSSAAVDAPAPYFASPPLKFVRTSSIPAIPFDQHNHDPALAVCPNGDVVATWFTTITEPGRESGIAIARLNRSSTVWPAPSLFWKTPRRMDCCPIMHYDDETGRLFHIHGTAAAATWGATMLIQRTSDDCGLTWSSPRIIAPEHYLHHQPINSFFRCADSRLVFTSDNTTIGSGGTVLHFSSDDGETWTDEPWPANSDGDAYPWGIHAGVAQLSNGSFLAFGRGNDIDGMMAQSLSTDQTASRWSFKASPWPSIHGSQRPSLISLYTPDAAAGPAPLLFCSFANDPMPVPTQCGEPRNVTGLYCAVSYDDGDTWPNVKLVGPDPSVSMGAVREMLDGTLFAATPTTGEPIGYTVARQSPAADRLIHLITSRNHYRFNQQWLEVPAGC